jgi:YihY family inner membrane protein
MSTAAPVPETWELTGDDAKETLRTTGRRTLLVGAFQRMRAADGFSHARSLAFLVGLLLVQATIALVGLAVAFGDSRFSTSIVSTIKNAVPGPAGDLLTGAVSQASEVGRSKRYLGLVIGLIGSLVSGTTALGQLERGLNRLYGVEQDRPVVQKYGRAFLLAATSGALVTAAFLSIGFGSSIGEELDNGWVDQTWNVARWPLAIASLVAAMALLFRWCPRRRQPAWSWLAFGSAVSVAIWVVVTAAMGAAFRLSTSFGDTYGSLAGIVALQLWAMLSSMGVLFGGAVAAQLEAVRAGVPGPQRASAEIDANAGLTGHGVADSVTVADLPDLPALSA